VPVYEHISRASLFFFETLQQNFVCQRLDPFCYSLLPVRDWPSRFRRHHNIKFALALLEELACYEMFIDTKKTDRVSQKKEGAKNRTLLRITQKSSKFLKIFIIPTSRELQNTYNR
jgi:hypothetical protein